MCEVYCDILNDICEALNLSISSGDQEMSFRLVNILSRFLYYVNEAICKGCDCCEKKDE